MSEKQRGGGRKSKMARGGDGIPQLPWCSVENPYANINLANEEEIEAIHRTSMRILSELGIRVMGNRIMELFEATGAIVDRAQKTIRLDESIVDAALKTTPSNFTLTSRNVAKQLTIGDRNVAFSLTAGSPNVHDCICLLYTSPIPRD